MDIGHYVDMPEVNEFKKRCPMPDTWQLRPQPGTDIKLTTWPKFSTFSSYTHEILSTSFNSYHEKWNIEVCLCLRVLFQSINVTLLSVASVIQGRCTWQRCHNWELIWHHPTCPTNFNKSPRQHLKSSSSPALIVPPTRRSSPGHWAFLLAAARAWNSLPSTVTAAGRGNSALIPSSPENSSVYHIFCTISVILSINNVTCLWLC